jgi:hypothetical protein
MRGFRLGVLLAALAALIVTSIAVADENNPSTRKSVTAHFTATGNVKTSSCTPQNAPNGGTPSGNTNDRRVMLSGTSTSADTRLNGPVRVALTVLVSPNGLGVATGTFRVVGKVEAELMASVSSTNRLDGFLRSKKGKRLFANFSATLAGSTLTGDLGSGSHLNTAVIGGGGGCSS